jgi:hypothetical protein
MIGARGFSRRCEYIVGGAASGGGQGASSGSSLAYPVRDGEILTSAFVPSNSENISSVTFLKHKISRKQELTLWHLVNRLVPEKA